MQVIVRSSELSFSWAVSGRPLRPSPLPEAAHSAIVSASLTTTQPVSVTQVVSITSVPGHVAAADRDDHALGRSSMWPAPRSSTAAKALGESKRGKQSHSRLPPKETRAAVWQSERKP